MTTRDVLGMVGRLGGRLVKHKHAGSDAAKVGLSPGTLIHVGEARDAPVEIRLSHVGAGGELEERMISDVADLEPYRTRDGVTWIDVTGIHDVDLVAAIGNLFGLHPLVLEDVVHARQRPKTEEYDGHLYVILKMLLWNEEASRVDVEQVSIVLGTNWVLTFQETPDDPFDFVRRRLREPTKRIRKSGADYLAYALMDSIVDNYFTVLETIGDRIEELEDAVVEHPDQDALNEVFRLKRTLVFLRRAIWPLRDAVSTMVRGELTLLRKSTAPFLRDLYDHVLRSVDLTETYRDMVAGMLDIYMSSVSNRMNDTMRVLTVIATIFIPLTFIAGVYGMNFENMPELQVDWGYYAVWGLMAAVAIGLLLFFHRKDWL